MTGEGDTRSRLSLTVRPAGFQGLPLCAGERRPRTR